MNEIWKDIKNYKGLYQISNLGRVKSLRDKNKKYREKILKQYKDNCGYYYITLSANSNIKKHKVHRLVAQAFIPNPENKKEVNHIDGNKENNAITNLEWCTGKENKQHAWKIGLCRPIHHTEETKRKLSEMRKGGKNPLSKRVRCITTYEIFGSVVEAAVKYNGDKTGIAKCCRGKLKTSGKHPVTGEKLIWEYMED